MSNDPNPNQWQPCSEGEFTALASRLERQHRREQMSKAMKPAGVVAALVLVAGLAISQLGDSHPGGITCQQCGAQFPQYSAHLAGNQPMTDTDATSMLEHLKGCAYCREHFEDKYPGLLDGVVAEHLQYSGRLLASRDMQVPLAVVLW